MKVVLGMSGGVDSATAAYLLQQAGHTVAGVTLVMCDAVAPDVAGAQETARRLGISHTVLDCRAAFWERVEQPFAASYQRGETPNPCVGCNREVKFAALLAHCADCGFDAIATGHYAQVVRDADTGRCHLLRGTDAAKDQSYMLYQLTQEQLAHTLFPLGNLHKTDVRGMAQQETLLPVIPKDSMDICFTPDGIYTNYLESVHHLQPMAGVFLNAEGSVVGTHQGQWHYTVGQRKGLGIALGEPVYVLAKDAASNTVTVGRETELFAACCTLRECRWLEPLVCGWKGTAKIRYSRTEAAVTVVEVHDDGTAQLQFDLPQRAMTPGQAVVCYEGERVMGGGILTAVCRHAHDAKCYE